MATELTASQKAQLFAMSTRQNMHMLSRETVSQTPATVKFTLPKSRLLSSLIVTMEFDLFVSTAKTVEYCRKPVDEIAKLVRRISLDLNNGFAPFTVSGEDLALYNLVDVNGDCWGNTNIDPQKSRNNDYNLSIGSSNFTRIRLTFELPVTLNGRDPVGLILLQNDQTNVTLTIDFGNVTDIFENGGDVGSNETGEGELTTMDSSYFRPELYSNITVDVASVTYSIPANANAYPDLSVLKLVNGRSDSLPSAGQHVIKLSTGTIYRKILFKITDEYGKAVNPGGITAPFELVFNQADVNYSVSAGMLRIINEKTLGHALPAGVYMFDFSNAGSFTNFGGTRDYIDTANLSEFWLRFSSNSRGKIEIITECLSRLTKNA